MSKKRSKFIQEQRYSISKNNKANRGYDKRVRKLNELTESYQRETKEIVNNSLNDLKELGLLSENININNINVQSKLFKVTFLRDNLIKNIDRYKNSDKEEDKEKMNILLNTLEDINSLISFKLLFNFVQEHIDNEECMESLESIGERYNDYEIMKNEETKIDLSTFDEDILNILSDDNETFVEFKTIFYNFLCCNLKKNYFFISQFVSIIKGLDKNDEYLKILRNNIINLVRKFIRKGDEEENDVQIS